jgi:threonine/homoserine/homoserine lactone efflux protein
VNDSFVVLVLGQLFFVVAACWIIANYVAKRERLRSEERLRILDRFTTAQELSDFLGSRTGQKLLDRLGGRSQRAAMGIVRAVRGGIILCFVGLGFLVFASNLKASGQELFGVGVMLVITGLGVIASAFVSAAVARRLGLLSGEQNGSGAPGTTEP